MVGPDRLSPSLTEIKGREADLGHGGSCSGHTLSPGLLIIAKQQATVYSTLATGV
jgi:hypothetical protein